MEIQQNNCVYCLLLLTSTHTTIARHFAVAVIVVGHSCRDRKNDNNSIINNNNKMRSKTKTKLKKQRSRKSESFPTNDINAIRFSSYWMIICCYTIFNLIHATDKMSSFHYLCSQPPTHPFFSFCRWKSQWQPTLFQLDMSN